MTKQLTVRQAKFVAAMQTGMDGKAAAIAAGYSPRSAKHAAYSLMHDNALVRAELDKVQQQLADVAEYNGERCMGDCDAALAFAEKTNNANAYVRAIELKARLTGLLRDKLDITVERKVDIAGALAEAKARALRLPCDSAQTVEGEFEQLPGVAATGSIDGQSVARGVYVNPLDLDL